MTEIAQNQTPAITTGLNVGTELTLKGLRADPSALSVRIPLNRTSCYARSFGNPQSRLFWWDGRLFCGLVRDQASLFRRLERAGIIGHLAQKNLFAEVEQADVRVDGFDFVLRIVPTPRVSYVYEWCPAMWRDAAVIIINVLSDLREHNLTLRNPHPWNVLFFGCQPLYIDHGSIVPFQEETFWRGYEKLCRFFIHPLLLNAVGQSFIGRRLLHDVNTGVRSEDFPHLAQFTLQLKEKRRAGGLAEFLSNLRKAVEGIGLPDPETKWTGYHGMSSPGHPKRNSKDKTIDHVLSDLRPKSLLDIGCNEGRYSRLADSLGLEVTAIDADEICVNHLYGLARTQNGKILPAVIDFTNPSPGYGVNYRWFPPATERLASEMVLGLAIEHHFVFGRYRLTFDEVARGFASFSNRWLLVEFIPPGTDTNANPQEWRPESTTWYNAECFAAALRTEFCKVTELPHSDGERVLFLCDKRD